MVLNFLRSGYEKVKGVLKRSGSLLGNKLRSLFQGDIDEETLEELERLLYEADLGVTTAMELTDKVRRYWRSHPNATADDYLQVIRTAIEASLADHESTIAQAPNGAGPTVLLIVGVNGSGKTTTIAKLAQQLKAQGKRILIGAADTFRAAAVEQIDRWAQQIGVDIVKGAPNSDPAAVAYDAVTAGQARGSDVVIIDTAGRLQNKSHLMQELEKVQRSCHKVIAGAPHETLLVIDANTGQNGIDQAKLFNSYVPISGIVLTKIDGTAKGGVVVSTQKELNIPVKFIGTGESASDLQPFDAHAFTSALFE